MKRKFFISVVASFLILFPALSQEIRKVSGTHTYIAPRSQSTEEAEMKAINNAQLHILADTYGTLVGTVTTTSISNDSNGNSITDTYEIGESEVKGEWLNTIGQPLVVKEFKNGELVITVSITGLVREIADGQVEFDAKILRNGIEDKFENLVFNDGDDFFMAFTAPVDGYLSVYMYDGKVVYCMLPYKAQTDGLFKVGGGVRYILFSKRDTDESFPAYLVDEMEVFATNEVEFNRLYVIFSPSMFIKAQDSSIEEELPRQLDFKSFQQWLFKLRKRDRSMTVKFFDITIKK